MHTPGQFCLNSSSNWTDISSSGLTSLPWVPPSLSYMGLGILLRCWPLWYGSLVLSNIIWDLLVSSGCLSSIQTHRQGRTFSFIVLVLPAQMPLFFQSKSQTLSPILPVDPLLHLYASNQHLPAFKSLFWQSRLERKILDHFWQSISKHPCLFSREREGAAASLRTDSCAWLIGKNFLSLWLL